MESEDYRGIGGDDMEGFGNTWNSEILSYISSPEPLSDASNSSDSEESLYGVEDNVENPIPNRPPFSLQKGHTFSNFKECRQAVIDAAINDGFEVRFPKSEKRRVAGYCCGEGCGWRIYATKVQDGDQVVITILEDRHTCSRLDYITNRMAGSVWVSTKILEMIRKHPDFSAKMIQSYIKSAFHLDIKYMTAWRAKDKCLQQIHGSWAESYKKLPSYIASLAKSNPGSRVALQLDVNGRFKRLFISYQACIKGFISGCRPLLFIDGTHVKRGYGGIILAAISVDGNNNIFPVAFSVVESESKDSWEWFFHQIQGIILQHPQFGRLTIISDRMRGLSDSVALYFPEAIHGSCAWHLSQNMQKKFGIKIVKNHFWRIAKALTTEEYDMYMKDLEKVNASAASWIKNNNPDAWATSKFPGETYGHITSNIAEVFNKWIRPARNLPIFAMVEDIRYLLMKKFCDSYHVAATTDKLITPYANKRLEASGYKSKSYVVRRSGEFIYEVRDENNWGFRVDLSIWECSCRGWQVRHLPCSHACAAIHTAKNKPIYEYCDRYYYMEAYHATYQDYIEPVLPDSPTGFSLTNDILPPERRRRPGRPKVKRRRSEALKEKRVMHCGACGQAGHRRNSCGQT